MYKADLSCLFVHHLSRCMPRFHGSYALGDAELHAALWRIALESQWGWPVRLLNRKMTWICHLCLKLGYTIPSTDESSFSPLFPRYFSINLPVFCGVHPMGIWSWRLLARRDAGAESSMSPPDLPMSSWTLESAKREILVSYGLGSLGLEDLRNYWDLLSFWVQSIFQDDIGGQVVFSARPFEQSCAHEACLKIVPSPMGGWEWLFFTAVLLAAHCTWLFWILHAPTALALKQKLSIYDGFWQTDGGLV